MGRVIFVTETYPQEIEFNSTHIMTEAILKGLVKVADEVIFVVICNKMQTGYINAQ